MYKNNILVLISILIVLLIVNIILTYNCYKKNKAENFSTIYFKNKAGFKDSIYDMYYANLISKVGTLEYKEDDITRKYDIRYKDNKKNLQKLKCYLSKNDDNNYAELLHDLSFKDGEGVTIDGNSEGEGCKSDNSEIMKNLNNLFTNHLSLQDKIDVKLKEYHITN